MHGRRRCARRSTRARDGVFAAVATAGTTNAGLLDDLAGAAAACREHGVWLHVDGAYGAAGLCAPSVRGRFAGIEHADSLIVDPHKWLFAPFDSCALLYREPALGRARPPPERLLPRRALPRRRGLQPVRLRACTSRAARAACRSGSRSPSTAPTPTRPRSSARSRSRAQGAEEIRARDELELRRRARAVGPRVPPPRLGAARTTTAGRPALREAGTAFVLPTTVRGETVARLALVNPRTTVEDLRVVLDTMR